MIKDELDYLRNQPGQEPKKPQSNQPAATTDTGTAGQTEQAAVTPAVTTTDTDAAEDDANENILANFLKDRETLNKEKEQIDKQNPNTPEAIKKTRRRALIASIADGLSALSGMYFATKGAPTTNNVVPGITEGIAKQNTADRNTYLEMLQNWRKRNNELINNYATYQATAERNRIANDNLRLSIDREARLYAKDEGERVYREALLKYKQDKMDDEKARWMAQIEQRKAELKARQEYWNRSLNIAQQRASNSGRNKKTHYNQKFENGQWVITDKEETYE